MIAVLSYHKHHCQVGVEEYRGSRIGRGPLAIATIPLALRSVAFLVALPIACKFEAMPTAMGSTFEVVEEAGLDVALRMTLSQGEGVGAVGA